MFPSGGTGHAMEGQPSFAGAARAGSIFDPSHYANETVLFRLDLGITGSGLAQNESWEVVTAFCHTAENEPPATEVVLHSNYPGPIHGRTTISYTLPKPPPVRLEVFNMLGRCVRMVESHEQAPATYTMDPDMSEPASGADILCLEAGRYQLVEPMVLVR